MTEPLSEAEVMRLAIALEARQECRDFHNYIDSNRRLVNGEDPLHIPESHKGLKVGENHEGSLRLDVRIQQGASWLAAAEFIPSVSPGDIAHRDGAARMARFARFGEQRLARGRQIRKWKQETFRDFFETGVSIVQQNPRAEYFQQRRNNPQSLVNGSRLTDIIWRRRVDPRAFYWQPDDEGDLDSVLIASQREVREVVRVSDRDRLRALRGKGLPWVEQFDERPELNSAQTDSVKELYVGGRGYLIAWGGTLQPDDPSRIIASWENQYGHPPFYVAAVGKQPWRSPLDEMFALTNERNYWATMLDLQAAGAIFRHWQLIDEMSGDVIAQSLWDNPVPENVLLDMTQPPPSMGPGKKWELAPFEFHDVLPRYQQIKEQHEDAGSSVARLMGQNVGPYTAVGTADMMEEHARREFHSAIEAFEDAGSAMWEDYFRWQKQYHPEKVYVVGRERQAGQSLAFFDSTIELTGDDIVSEDVRVRLDTRSRIGRIADYRLGREMRNNGDMDFERAVEQGLVPWVEDAKEEVAAIFVSTLEKMNLELQAQAAIQQIAQNLGLMGGEPAVEPPNITRGARTDPRGTGVQQGAGNVSNSALSDGAVDAGRV